MVERRIPRLPGMRDVIGDRLAQKSRVVDDLRQHLERGGCEAIDTPLLEETELFVRKSGGEISGRLYTFTDPGGHRVSLRPEFTPSIIRNFIQEQDSFDQPVRLQYGGPVFRYEGGNGDGYRQFTQVGAEIIGDGTWTTDAEVVTMAHRGLKAIGIENAQVRIGHIGVLTELLSEFELSDSAMHLIISQVQSLKSGKIDLSGLHQRALDMGLLRAANGQGANALSSDEFSNESAQAFILDLLRDSIASPLGSRSPEQIAERMLRKAREATDQTAFEGALALANELARLDGVPDEVLTRAKTVLSSRGLSAGPLDQLGQMLDVLALDEITSSQVVLDLGLARGISYYTGVIFELIHSSPLGETSLGGGGRYDSLVKSLGGRSDVPALGFAYYVEQIMEVLGNR